MFPTKKSKVEDEWGNTHFLNRDFMNRMILDFLVANSYKDAALKFSEDTKIPLSCDIAQIDLRVKLRNIIIAEDFLTCIAEVNSIFPNLFSQNSQLLFDLYRLTFISFLKRKDIMGAVTFAKEKINHLYHNHRSRRRDIKMMMSLIVVYDNKELWPKSLKNIAEDSYKYNLADRLNAIVLKEQGLCCESAISDMLRHVLFRQNEFELSNIPKIVGIGTNIKRSI